jgi:hypothetical protein
MLESWDETEAKKLIDSTLERIENAVTRNPFSSALWDTFENGCAKAFRAQDAIRLSVVCEAYQEAMIYGRAPEGNRGKRANTQNPGTGTMETTMRAKAGTSAGLAAAFAIGKEREGE